MLARELSPIRHSISKPLAVYPRAASMSSLQSLLMEDPSPSMLSDSHRPPADPTAATNDGLLLMALQERLTSQMRPSFQQQQPMANLEANRFLQSIMLGLPLMSNIPNQLDLSYLQHNLCTWPGCNQPCENLSVFLTHLGQVHQSDERSTSDMRTQVEMVENLEHRLTKERTRLQAMMQHLHMKHSPDTTTPTVGKMEPTSPAPQRVIKQEPIQPVSVATSVMPQIQTLQLAPMTPMAMAESSSSDPSPSMDNKPFVARRSRVTDKSVLPISADIARNREFYRTNDVRPPYTYASLIRQAIMESADCQLTLNEIYTWFTDTFAYFRRNAATWKNAVRHNLSLHKCFQRVEQNVKGAVWTVDDSEFYRRRPQRNAATRSQPNTPLPDEVMAQRLIDQTTMSLLDRGEVTRGIEGGLTLNGDMGLQGVLNFLANSGHDNPLALLSHTAAHIASSQPTSSTNTPAPYRDERMDIDDCGLDDPDATPPASKPSEDLNCSS